MELTTHLEHESQRTRLEEQGPYVAKLPVTNGILTLYDTPFQGIYTGVTTLVTCLEITTRAPV